MTPPPGRKMSAAEARAYVFSAYATTFELLANHKCPQERRLDIITTIKANIMSIDSQIAALAGKPRKGKLRRKLRSRIRKLESQLDDVRSGRARSV